jgi:hypothetical protein
MSNNKVYSRDFRDIKECQFYENHIIIVGSALNSFTLHLIWTDNHLQIKKTFNFSSSNRTCITPNFLIYQLGYKFCFYHLNTGQKKSVEWGNENSHLVQNLYFDGLGLQACDLIHSGTSCLNSILKFDVSDSVINANPNFFDNGQKILKDNTIPDVDYPSDSTLSYKYVW